MEKDLKILEKYNYTFSKELIAQEPASPRDSARLLVYNRTSSSVAHNTFRNLTKYLPPRSVLVFNDTKVIPARFIAYKSTGGKVTLLYLGKVAEHKKEHGREHKICILSDKKLEVGSTLRCGKYEFIIETKKDGQYILGGAPEDFDTYLLKHGITPIPPYIKHTTLSERELRERYQTIFAKQNGSVAAPTASLHFTRRLMNSLRKAGHQIEFVTLHVNLGTFAKLTEEQLCRGKLHKEFYELSSETAQGLRKAKKEGRPIIAVGTTVVRTLETFSRSGQNSGTTDLFIREGYSFKYMDGLITNFHVPRSSLLMLVSAFAGRKNILNLYQQAIERKYKLFSFGDGMLIL